MEAVEMRYLMIAALSCMLVFVVPSSLLAQKFKVRIDTKVVAVFVTKKKGAYHKPWKSPNFRPSRGTGFFFKDEKAFPGEKGLILTNAHVVAMAQNIEVSNGREKRRYKVKLFGICHLADFAVLQMEPQDLETYEKRNGKVVPLRLGNSDKLRVGDKVLGWGYPLGGERISKSEEGEINRIEVRQYAYSHENWLMVQASLQQNPGNSGGPIFKGDQVVGIAFEGMRAADRINYFIPINLVKSLMPLLKRQEMIPRWRYVIQYLNPPLKSYYDLGPEDGGLLLNYVITDGGPYRFGLRTNDIVLEIDGNDIDDFGDIFFEPLEQRISFLEVLNRKSVGDSLAVKVMREGKILEIQGEIHRGLPRLVPKVFTRANYFVYGGIGLVELTYNTISDLGKSGFSLKEKYLKNLPEKPNQKIVIIAEIFPEYGLTNAASYLRKRVEKINGEDVLNIEHLFDAIQSLKKNGKKKALLAISNNVQLPIDFETAEALDSAIKEKYGILYMKTSGGFFN
jgi:large subunit ribosomal protein L28